MTQIHNFIDTLNVLGTSHDVQGDDVLQLSNACMRWECTGNSETRSCDQSRCSVTYRTSSCCCANNFVPWNIICNASLERIQIETQGFSSFDLFQENWIHIQTEVPQIFHFLRHGRDISLQQKTIAHIPKSSRQFCAENCVSTDR